MLYLTIKSIYYMADWFRLVFFLPCIHGPRASRLGHKRKEKNSVHNLPYGPSKRG